jgi:hypothetical protein
MPNILAQGLTPEESAIFTKLHYNPKGVKGYVMADPSAGSTALEHPMMSTLDWAASRSGVSAPLWLKKYLSGADPGTGVAQRVRNIPASGLAALSRDYPRSVLWGDRKADRSSQ